MNNFLNIIGKRVSLQQFIANELLTYNCICGIFYVRKAVACLLLNSIAVSISFWLHQLYVVVFVGAIMRRANSFPFIHNSNFIQQCQRTMKLELSRTIVHLILRPATRKLPSLLFWCFSPSLIHYCLSSPPPCVVIA